MESIKMRTIVKLDWKECVAIIVDKVNEIVDHVNQLEDKDIEDLRAVRDSR